MQPRLVMFVGTSEQLVISNNPLVIMSRKKYSNSKLGMSDRHAPNIRNFLLVLSGSPLCTVSLTTKVRAVLARAL
jgi:hypothetical protein